MIEVWLVFFTAFPPHVEGMLQEAKMFDWDSCEAVIESQTAAMEQFPGYVFTGHCERRRKEKPKEKK